jgi:hypothetical protein
MVNNLHAFPMKNNIQMFWWVTFFVISFNCWLSSASEVKDLLLRLQQAEGIEGLLDRAVVKVRKANLTLSTRSHEAIHRHWGEVLTHIQIIIEQGIRISRFLYRTFSDKPQISLAFFSHHISARCHCLNNLLLLLYLIFIFVCRNADNFFCRLGLFNFLRLFGDVGLTSIVLLAEIDFENCGFFCLFFQGRTTV